MDEKESMEQVIHGDIHIGNVIWSKNSPYLIDFEDVSIGNKNWDLVTEVIFLERGKITEKQYSDFCIGYGFDVRVWKHFELAYLTKELFIIIWMAGLIEGDESMRDSFRKRLEEFNQRFNLKYDL